jgi:hypothetical protein
VNLQPQCVRRSFLGNLDRICLKFGSSGLNLVCEELLLKMWDEDPPRLP